MTTIPLDVREPNRLQQFLNTARQGNGVLWTSTIVMLGLALVCLGLQQVDGRLVHGANVWIKPAKFFLSLAIHFVTVSWAIGLMPQTDRQRLGVKGPSLAMAAAGWLEMVYIVARATRGEASHFNTDTPLDATLYSLMGFGAVTITAATFIVGAALWRMRGDLLREAAAVGLMAGAVLGTLAGGYLSSHSGHWVGGDLTDATGTGFFGWSTTGGDLRVAHFLGLHLVQIVPLAALARSRGVVYVTLVLGATLTLAVFVQAIMGVPLFRV